MTTTIPDSPPARRRRRDPEATRTAILDAAEELFVDLGPADTPTSKIARRAGVTKSLIHHHFGSKEDLWGEVKRRHFGRYYEAQKQMLADARGSVGMLRNSIVTFFRFLQSDPRSVRFMSWRLLEQEDPCLDLEEELFELGMRRIEEAQESRELRSDVEPISMIKSFLAMALHWFQSKPLLCQILGPEVDPDALDEQYLEDLLRIFLEGVRPR